jgi:2-polyprenyl-6-hydroxyphenyl methylase/3-demethylubiquinone-9 3-methyltransferase
LGLEIIEHVSDRFHFLNSITQLTKPGGKLFLSTIGQSQLSKFLTIYLAQDILQWVPKGTHDYEKYVNSEQLCNELSAFGCQVNNVTGMHYIPLKKCWVLGGHSMVNYMLTATKL